MAIDLAGILLLICAALFGWLPGPGGIPLLLAGLGLLATNHEWARRLLKHVERHGVKIADTFFKEHKLLMAFYDVLTGVFVVIAIVVFTAFTNNLLQATASVFAFIALGLFLGNRKRIKRITKALKKKP